MKVAIILNGETLNCPVLEDFIICADGGYHLLKDKSPDVVLGDFDSLLEMPKTGKILKVPAEKNYTDGELAVRYAVETGAKEIVIYGATGGRIDHVFANFALLKLAFDLGAQAIIRNAEFNAEYVEGLVERTALEGSTVSLLPYGGDVVVSNSDGLYYPLNPLTISVSGASRGVSNITTKEVFCYDIKTGGALLIINNKA